MQVSHGMVEGVDFEQHELSLFPSFGPAVGTAHFVVRKLNSRCKRKSRGNHSAAVASGRAQVIQQPLQACKANKWADCLLRVKTMRNTTSTR